MIINLMNLVPEVSPDEEPGSLVIHFTKADVTDAYRTTTPGLLNITEQKDTEQTSYRVQVRPPLIDEEARVERWEFDQDNGAGATQSFAIEIRSPCRHPTIMLFVGNEPLINIRPSRPFDAWDGRNMLPAKTSVYDRLLQGEDLLGGTLSF